MLLAAYPLEEAAASRSFGILGIAEIDLLHRRLISAGPWQMTALVRVPVVDLHGGDIVLLPLRLGTGRFRLLDGLPAPLQRGDVERDERVRAGAHRDAPVAHRARRIALRH